MTRDERLALKAKVLDAKLQGDWNAAMEKAKKPRKPNWRSMYILLRANVELLEALLPDKVDKLIDQLDEAVACLSAPKNDRDALIVEYFKKWGRAPEAPQGQ